jgi:hypothetical protein
MKEAGYDFFFDPLIGVRGTVKDIEVPPSEIPMSAGVHMVDEGYMMTDMAHPFATTALFASGVFRFDKTVVVKKVVAFFYKFLSSMISKNVHVQGANMIAPD